MAHLSPTIQLDSLCLELDSGLLFLGSQLHVYNPQNKTLHTPSKSRRSLSTEPTCQTTLETQLVTQGSFFHSPVIPRTHLTPCGVSMAPQLIWLSYLSHPSIL